MSSEQEGQDLSPRERRAVRTREAIIDAARCIIRERGAYGLSLREVARRIDYSPAGLYEYFGSKDELIAAVIRDGFERFAHYQATVATHLPPGERLYQLGIAYIRFARENPHHFMLIFNTPDLHQAAFLNQAESDDDFLAKGTYQTLVEAVKACFEVGDIHPGHHLDTVILNTWAMVHGLATLILAHPHPEIEANWEAIADQLLNTSYNGLKHRP